MPYVQRNAAAQITGVFANQQPGYADEFLPDSDPALIAFLNPPNVIPFATFIQRWTAAEYVLLGQKRAAAFTAGNATLALQWDTAAAMGSVNLASQAALNFKASMVSNGILTQARADVIFS